MMKKSLQIVSLSLLVSSIAYAQEAATEAQPEVVVTQENVKAVVAPEEIVQVVAQTEKTESVSVVTEEADQNAATEKTRTIETTEIVALANNDAVAPAAVVNNVEVAVETVVTA